MEKETVNIVCTACDGTGLYEGMCEEKGHPVICIQCEGTGCVTLSYTPFKERRIVEGVIGVSKSRGTFIGTGVGGYGEEITYEEFLKMQYPMQEIK